MEYEQQECRINLGNKRRILGIDPSPDKQAYVMLVDGKVTSKGFVNVCEFRNYHLGNDERVEVAIETIQSFGMPVGKSVFETCQNIGRIREIFRHDDVFLYKRSDIKMHFCNTTRAKDSNIRQAMLDRYGGCKKGEPLEGIKKDLWSALALCTYHKDKIET